MGGAEGEEVRLVPLDVGEDVGEGLGADVAKRGDIGVCGGEEA